MEFRLKATIYHQNLDIELPFKNVEINFKFTNNIIIKKEIGFNCSYRMVYKGFDMVGKSPREIFKFFKTFRKIKNHN